jgi:hypothetical protein
VALFVLVDLNVVVPLLTRNSFELTSAEPLCSLEFLVLKKQESVSMRGTLCFGILNLRNDSAQAIGFQGGNKVCKFID